MLGRTNTNLYSGVPLNGSMQDYVVKNGQTIVSGDAVEFYSDVKNLLINPKMSGNSKIFKLTNGNYIVFSAVGQNINGFCSCIVGTNQESSLEQLTVPLSVLSLNLTNVSVDGYEALEIDDDTFLVYVPYCTTYRTTATLYIYYRTVTIDASTNSYTISEMQNVQVGTFDTSGNGEQISKGFSTKVSNSKYECYFTYQRYAYQYLIKLNVGFQKINDEWNYTFTHKIVYQTSSSYDGANYFRFCDGLKVSGGTILAFTVESRNSTSLFCSYANKLCYISDDEQTINIITCPMVAVSPLLYEDDFLYIFGYTAASSPSYPVVKKFYVQDLITMNISLSTETQLPKAVTGLTYYYTSGYKLKAFKLKETQTKAYFLALNSGFITEQFVYVIEIDKTEKTVLNPIYQSVPAEFLDLNKQYSGFVEVETDDYLFKTCDTNGYVFNINVGSEAIGSFDETVYVKQATDLNYVKGIANDSGVGGDVIGVWLPQISS